MYLDNYFEVSYYMCSITYNNGGTMLDFESLAKMLFNSAENLKKDFPDPTLKTPLQVKILIREIEKSSQENYTTKQISEVTEIPEWKLRKFIAFKELKADSNNSSAENPGRSGYTISKENLIDFFQKNYNKISLSRKAEEDAQQSLLNIIKIIKKFIARFDSTISLGELELKLTKFDHNNEESKEILEKEIMLQKLKIEKMFFEELQESYENIPIKKD